MIDRETYFKSWHSRCVGWCKPAKAEAMMDEIKARRPKLCVEVGVFGGQSLFPTALALQENDFGMVYGVDPWTADASLEGKQDAANAEWWSSKHLQYEAIHAECLGLLLALRLTKYCSILRLRSDQAARMFQRESIDILHLDGNHSPEVSMDDVQVWFPLVKSGGLIWFDDCNWESLRGTFAMLQTQCKLVRIVENCALLEKP